MKYILIDEFGTVYKSDVISDNEKSACNDGILDIIDVENVKRFANGQWHDLEVWEAC